MTVAELANLSLSIHGAIWVAAAVAFYKFGDRKVLFDKVPQECRLLMQAIKDEITTDLRAQLRPIVRDSTRIRTGILRPEGDDYIEEPVDVTEGEGYYQAIRDFVTNSSGALVDFSLLLTTVSSWSKWAHLLSTSILILVILESVVLAVTLIARFSIDNTAMAPSWSLLLNIVPSAIVVIGVFICLVLLHVKQGVIYDLKVNYDT